MGFPIINPGVLGGIGNKDYRKCPKCRGNGYVGVPKTFGNYVCDRYGGSGLFSNPKDSMSALNAKIIRSRIKRNTKIKKQIRKTYNQIFRK